MQRLLSLLSLYFIAFLPFLATPVQANGDPLPAIPGQSVLNQVISQTSGIPFTPLGVPNHVDNQLATFGGAFAGVQNMLEEDQAVSYFSTGKAMLELVIPLQNNATATLDPDMTAPGINPKPGKIVGAVFQPYRGVMVVVAVFQSGVCPSCAPPDKLRFYYNNTQYEEYSVVWGEFVDPDGNSVVDAIDEGAVIAHDYSCVTVGLEQVCWEPDSYSDVRDEPAPQDIAYDAYTEFENLYDMNVDFYVDDAVPDLFGSSTRARCANKYATANNFNNIGQCNPNLIFTAATSYVPGEPIGIFVTRRATNQIAIYKDNGQSVGALPVGEYLVINATPNVGLGQIGVLFLVNSDQQNHYLIPYMKGQVFGDSTASDESFAAIKDGYIWGHSFGY